MVCGVCVCRVKGGKDGGFVVVVDVVFVVNCVVVMLLLKLQIVWW